MGFFDWARRAFGAPAKATRDNFSGTYGPGAPGGFAGAGINRLTASLAAWSGSINADLDGNIAILRARGRQLGNNNSFGRRFLSLVATNIIGQSGPKLQVRAKRDQRDPTKPTTLDKAANDAVEIHFARWGRACDITGRARWPQFLRIVAKAVARDGECLVRIVRRRDLPYGIALQALEADRLEDTLNQSGPRTIRQGVEIDDTGRPIAYWLRKNHPGDRYGNPGANTLERVQASDIYHIYLPERAEQVRGVTWFHAVLLDTHQLGGYKESAVIAARIGASKIAALERAEEAPDIASTLADSASGGALQMNVEAGELFELPPGYKLNSWNPEYPHANFDSFMKAALRGIAAGLDVATHNLSGDMTEVNYSSARIAELAEREIWMALQDWFIGSFIEPVYREWLASALLRGDITFEISGKSLPADKLGKFADASLFRGRRWRWVDPAKEIAAYTEGVALGITSRTRIAAEQGDDFDDVLDELQQEAGALADAGIKDTPPPAPPADPANDPAVKAAQIQADARVRSAELARDAARASQPQINITLPASPEVRVDNHIAAPAPAVVPAPEVRIDNHIAAPQVTIEPAAVDVRVEAVMPEQPAPVVEVKVETPDEITIKAMPVRETTTQIERNASGDIVKSTQVEADA